MSRKPHAIRPTESPRSSLTLAELEHEARSYVLRGEIDQRSVHTRDNRERATGRLLWFLRHRGLSVCGEREVMEFLAYLARGHLEPGGRWEELLREDRRGKGLTRGQEPVKPSTVRYYHSILRGFFNHLVEQGILDASPLARLKAPSGRQDQIMPLSEDQIRALLAAAKKTRQPERDYALVSFLYDTGARASEVLGITIGDLDLRGRRCTVLGKGGKRRQLSYSAGVEAALMALLGPRSRVRDLEPDTPIFRSWHGPGAGKALSRGGLTLLIHNLGKAAGITGVRCSPHTLRHSFAIAFLRGGGDVFSLKEVLGHESLDMCLRYLKLAQADIEAAHRKASPMAALFRKR